LFHSQMGWLIKLIMEYSIHLQRYTFRFEKANKGTSILLSFILWSYFEENLLYFFLIPWKILIFAHPRLF